jgi:hypothetical protein
VFLAAADLTNATLTSNQVIHVAGGSGANHSDNPSRISTWQAAAVATVPSTHLGNGDSAGGQVHRLSAAAAGLDTGLTGSDAFAHIDAVISDILFSRPA